METILGVMTLFFIVYLLFLAFSLIAMFFEDFLDLDLKKCIKESKKRKEEKRSQKKFDKSIKKYSKNNDMSITILSYDYAIYVSIIDEIVKSVCSQKKYSTNNMYLLKFFEYIKDKKIDVYSVEGIYYLIKSVSKCPVINIKDIDTYNKNIEVLKKLLSYDFPKKYLYYNNQKVTNVKAKLIELLLNN